MPDERTNARVSALSRFLSVDPSAIEIDAAHHEAAAGVVPPAYETLTVAGSSYAVLDAEETAAAWRAAILRDLDDAQKHRRSSPADGADDRERWVAELMRREDVANTLSIDRDYDVVDGFNIFRVK